ncbi:MAG TPA: PQQ-binding-like beta-propeller repeat protein [Vicinamibacterales bacterium]|nr:PQQ-binding-like beta-propeller repeat protein [Vicinamibacterales bacterium]
MRPRMAALAVGLFTSMVAARSATVQQAPPARGSGDWPMYRHDPAGTGHSPLTQITPANVPQLTRRWTYRLQSAAPAAPAGRGGGGGVNSEATPIVVNGVMYLPAANRVVALEPETGKELWQFPISGGAPSRRGVAYWAGDDRHPPRIVFTVGRRLIALEARTGALDRGFGRDGEIDLGVPYNSVPFIHRNVVVVGANTPPGAIGGIGNPRAFDVRTGARLWEFSSVPRPGEVGHDTWEGDSWRDRLGVNAWPFYFTLDEPRGLLFIPLASPIPGAYGGDRKGANLFGNSVVAVDVETGKYRWHFQTIHHDLWDADPPAPPGLFDISRNGRTIPAVALTTKSGYLYILNRITGEPAFGAVERDVAKSDVPGEQAFPTQPIPVKPPPIARTEFKPADLVTDADTTPEHAAACREIVEKNGVYNAGPFTPWAYRAPGAPPKTALVFPGGLGGANWGGTAYAPEPGYVFVATQDVGALGWMESRDGSLVSFDKASPERPAGRGIFDVRIDGVSWPCQKPPWGRLMAINAATGDIAWQTPLGITEQLPAARRNTGRPLVAGPIVTAGGVVFIGATDDNRFRALDARSGRELWTTTLERRGNANPITYQGKDGKQYVAIVATDALVVYALP